MRKSLKRTLIIDAIVLVSAIVMFAYTSFAYFSETRQISSTITSGNVSIVLTEASVKRDAVGNLVQDPDKPRIIGSADQTDHDYGTVYPGQSIFKDPTVTNTGSDKAYIAAKVTITDGRGDVHKVLGIDGYDDIDITMLISGGLLDESSRFGTWNGIEDVTYNDHYAMVQVPSRIEGKYEFYFFILDPVESHESVVFFEQVFFSSGFNNSEMQEFIDLKIDFRGFGVQTFGFASCYEAMTTALPEYFTSVTHSAR